MKLYYDVQNGGDGSAYPRFYQTQDEAEIAQNKHNEEGEGWGEDCTGSVELKVEDGTVFFKSQDWDEKTNKLVTEWKELK
jgi:hypothetical protein